VNSGLILASADRERFPLRCERCFYRIDAARSAARTVWTDALDFASSRGKARALRGSVALYATIFAEQCSGEFVGFELYGKEGRLSSMWDLIVD